jgi:hypothetical protein
MYEIIITTTHVDEEVGGVPYTKVYRFEFESEEQIDRLMTTIQLASIGGGQMRNE